MSELTGSNHRCRAQFKCVQTVVGQRFAGNGPIGLSYYYYYYYYTYFIPLGTPELLSRFKEFLSRFKVTFLIWTWCTRSVIKISLLTRKSRNLYPKKVLYPKYDKKISTISTGKRQNSGIYIYIYIYNCFYIFKT